MRKIRAQVRQKELENTTECECNLLQYRKSEKDARTTRLASLEAAQSGHGDKCGAAENFFNIMSKKT